MQQIWRWTIVSILAGVVLGFFLKGVQALTGEKVYILLLNIDYIPLLNRWDFGREVEFILHLVISIIIGDALQWFVHKWRLGSKQQFIVIILASFVVAITYYPVTTLSDKTPDLLSITAFFWWMLGHFLYGTLLYFSYRKIAKI